MSAINYTYFITIGAVETQVHPSGDWSLKIAKAEEDFPFCKDYRIKFDGEFIFSGDDYDLIKTADCCDKIDLRIQCDGVNYWYGYFAYPYDLKFDEDRCEVSGTPKPLDKYYYLDVAPDFKRRAYATDTFIYQDNFPIPPTNDTWYNSCLDCTPLWDYLNLFIGFPLWPGGFTINLRSTFFNNDPFPDLTDPYPDGAGAINYVTGCATKLNHIVIAPAIEVCSLGATAGAWPEFTWNELMEEMHKIFNTWWYIDEQGDMRIEHISFWELYFPASYDLTTIDAGRWIVNSSKYDYRNEEMPTEEQWEWSEMKNTFVDGTITYYICFLPGTARYIKEYPLKNLTTDLEYIAPGTQGLNISPDDCGDIPSDDYMLIRCITRAEAIALGYGTVVAIPACTYCAWFSRYVDDGDNHLNAHLSSLNLLVNYWMHDRPLWTGFFPDFAVSINFKSTWKNLRQMELAFPVCCAGEAIAVITGTSGTNPRYLYEFGIDFLEPIITQYGDGELYTGTIKDGMLSLQLIFEDLRCKGTPTVWSNPCEL